MDLQTQSQVAINDPWDSAENPQFAAPEYWGLCSVDMYFCILQKGTGKIRFEPGVHDVDKRRTAIDIVISPLPAMNATKNVERSMVAESKEWAGIVLPSLKALGISPKELLGKYVHIRFKATGKTYKNSSGEIKDSTTIEFVKVFNSEAECQADYQSNSKSTVTPTESGAQPAGVVGGKERETALQFLKVVVENAVRGQTDLNVIRNTVAANVAGMPLVNKFFTVDSPETLALIAEKMSK